jgi:hypothetical protein
VIFLKNISRTVFMIKGKDVGIAAFPLPTSPRREEAGVTPEQVTGKRVL